MRLQRRPNTRPPVSLTYRSTGSDGPGSIVPHADQRRARYRFPAEGLSEHVRDPLAHPELLQAELRAADADADAVIVSVCIADNTTTTTTTVLENTTTDHHIKRRVNHS